MKLYYYYYYYGDKKPVTYPNFGDLLNEWLWPKLLFDVYHKDNCQDIFDEDDTAILVGIGTLLNRELEQKTPNARLRMVFSSGVGYGTPLQKLDETYKVYCVRGPLSASKLQLSPDKGLVDGGIMIRRYFNPPRKVKYKYSYMPHHGFSGSGWENVCKSLNFGYIDPSLPVEDVMTKICETEILLTEAMHGAITAEAFRVPWVPVKSHDMILTFKWEDWCASVNLKYEPQTINRLLQPNPVQDLMTPIRRVRDWTRQRLAAQELKALANNCRPILGDENHLENLTVELENRLEQLKSDLKAGCLGP
ncbi:MAG: Exopolysaccharide glucosyl ketal-pyruvate-transferase [Chroococcopsis gigantea SAG 12.99]|jgi:succinoglycan biosynthesis protein ExoV|nr:polysaccharide pyruvyl transferase family protein [Chlorogloea purpurea SAG 13.99]MDV3001759.1 Exopolysaccharide glucosyl ketal-pyruvate-transferase [Chroococcopsis gigantea SAG 12.99]